MSSLFKKVINVAHRNNFLGVFYFIINNFVIDFIKDRLIELEPSTLSDFLNENISNMESCTAKEYFELIQLVFYYLNEKRGFLEKEEIKLDIGYYNNLSPKTMEFYVLRVPSVELSFHVQLQSLFLSTKNSVLENFLCRLLANVISKPEYASSDCNMLYEQEQNKMIQKTISNIKLNKGEEIFSDEVFVDSKVIQDIPETYLHLSNKFIERIKFVKFLNYFLGLSEREGFGKLISVASLKESHFISLSFERETRTAYKTTTKYTFINT